MQHSSRRWIRDTIGPPAYRALYRQCLDGVFFTAPDGRIIAANRAACDMLRMSEEEICRLGRSGLADRSDERWAALVAQREQTGNVRGVARMLRGDGVAIEAEMASQVFTDDEGELRTCTVIRDVSERVAADRVLQRSLLPRRLPRIPGWEFSARYLPATRSVEIGGDWYSLVDIDDDRFAVVVGDVSGHDLAAAGVMAGLAFTIRTLARLGIAPGEIIERAAVDLDDFTDHHFATVLVGVVNTRTQELTVASAGHLPPLMLCDGRAEFVQVSPGAPLGVGGAPVESRTVSFPPGCTMVVFTDGLIERRGELLENRLDQLAAALITGPEQLDDLITSLVSTMTGDDHEDDIAVLAARFSGQ